MRACCPDWGELLAGLGRNKVQALEKAEKVSEEKCPSAAQSGRS